MTNCRSQLDDVCNTLLTYAMDSTHESVSMWFHINVPASINKVMYSWPLVIFPSTESFILDNYCMYLSGRYYLYGQNMDVVVSKVQDEDQIQK